MNLWSRQFFTDDELVQEIKDYAGARRKVSAGNPAEIVRKVQGEGRLIEFMPVADSVRQLNADLREMMAEARRRGLEIGGEGGGMIGVETGL